VQPVRLVPLVQPELLACKVPPALLAQSVQPDPPVQLALSVLPVQWAQPAPPATGVQGPAGATGPAGPEGPTGPAGPSGTTGLFGTNNINFFSEGGAGAQCTLGSVILNVAVEYPGNYLPADGRTLAITSNTALFSLIGIDYGGDGMTTFALPDLRKAAPNNTQYLICVAGIFP
jgi:hypothetical protein